MSPYVFGILLFSLRLGFRGLSPYSFGILFHHHFLVPARVPGFVSLFFWQAMSPYSFGILFHHHFMVPARVLGLVSPVFWHPHPFLVPARVPGLSPTLSASCSIIVSWFGLGFRAQTSLELNGVLNSFKKQFCSTRLVPGILAFCSIIISSVLLVAGRVPGIVSLVFWHSVPSSCPDSICFQEGLWGLSP